MTIRLILWLSVIWLAPMLYVQLNNETKFKKNIAVGVTLPFEARENDQVKARLSRFTRELRWICAALFLIAVACIFIESLSLTMFLWCLWLIFCVVVPYIPYILCNRDLKKLKQENGWKRTDSSIVTVDTSAMPANRWLSPLWFVPALLLSLLPLIWERAFWPIYMVDALCVIGFFFCYRYLYRNKSERVDENTELTMALTQIRRYNWGKNWLICAYSIALLSFVMPLMWVSPLLSMVLTFLLTFLIAFFCIRVEFKTRKMQEKLTAQSGKGAYIDDDDCWIWGIFYYNPNDSHTLVNNRIGVNSTFNMAKPAGKIVMTFCALLLLGLPLTGPIIEFTANQPIEIQATETQIDIKNGMTSYTISTSEIDTVALLGELPANMMKTMGSGMENLLKGQFYAKSVGNMNVCLDPTVSPFILLTTTDGENYLFGLRDAEETRALFKQILGKE